MGVLYLFNLQAKKHKKKDNRKVISNNLATVQQNR